MRTVQGKENLFEAGEEGGGYTPSFLGLLRIFNYSLKAKEPLRGLKQGNHMNRFVLLGKLPSVDCSEWTARSQRRCGNLRR